MLNPVPQDLRFAFRSLRRSPVFAITAVLTLACGIGFTAAMCGVARQALLAPLPYPDPDRLVALDFNYTGNKPSASQVGTVADFEMRYSRSFRSYGVSDGGTNGINLADPASGKGHAFTVQQLRVSRGFLPTLGIVPQLGRLFTAEEDTHNGPHVALLSDAMWRSHFAADPNIVGRIVRIDEEDVPVVGVLPPNVVADLQGGTRTSEPAGILQPLQLSEHDPGYEGNNYQMIACLRNGVSLEQARAELATLLPRFAQENTWYKRWHTPSGELNQLRVFPLQAALTGEVRGSLLALLGAAATVLLVACLNLAGLMVSRTTARTRELAVRSALGAGRARLLRLLLTESLLLAACGAALGVLLAQVAAKAFVGYAPIELPHWNDSTSVGSLALFAGALAALATLFFGIVPALVALRREVNQSLRDVGAQGQSAAYQRMSRALIVAQVSLAFVLLTAASLLLQTFLRMRSTAPGVDTANITIGQVTLKGDAYANTAKTIQFQDRVVQQLQHTPGVVNAAAVNGLPLDHGLNISGWPVGRNELRQSIEARFVDPSYFTTIGIGLLQGRGVRLSDTANSPRVAVISQRAANRWWPNGNAIGSRINLGSEAEYEIVGIARDTHEHSLLEPPRVLAYIPLPQVTDKFTKMIHNWFPTTFVVRASTGVNVAAAIQSAVSNADPELPVSKLATMESMVDDTIATPRFFGWLSSTFAGFTLLLAALGIFGLLSYQVTQRTREIGVRMALGATRANVLRSFIVRGFALTSIGLALGASLSLAVPRLLAAAVPEFVAMAHAPGAAHTAQLQAGSLAFALLLTGAAAACMLPAARAAQVDPIVALRTE